MCWQITCLAATNTVLGQNMGQLIYVLNDKMIQALYFYDKREDNKIKLLLLTQEQEQTYSQRSWQIKYLNVV